MDAPSPLHFQRCAACTAAVHPPRTLCPRCGATSLAWKETAAAGTVYSTTAVHTREETYNVALVDLDEGYRVMTTVRGTEPDAVPIGARVQGRVEDDRLVFDL
jgi:uncharacterized OB-fold protein